MDYIQRKRLTLSLTLSTVFLHAEYLEHPSSDGPPTGEWVLTDTAEGRQLGTEDSVKKKGDIISTGDHESLSCSILFVEPFSI